MRFEHKNAPRMRSFRVYAGRCGAWFCVERGPFAIYVSLFTARRQRGFGLWPFKVYPSEVRGA